MTIEVRKGLYGFDMIKPDGRRAPEGERKTYEIQGLWQRSHEIINLHVRGFKNVEIAKILNIDPMTVSNTVNCELGELKISELRKGRNDEAKQICEKVRVLTDRALNIYHEVFDDESGECTMKDKKDAAKDVVMELSGLRAPTKVQTINASLTLTPEELKSFKDRGLKAISGNDNNEIVELEPEVNNDSVD